MKRALMILVITLMNCLISNDVLSQIKSLPQITTDNKWYYSYSADITNSISFDNYNEIWEYVKDTVVITPYSTTAYKLFKSTVYDLSRKLVISDYFLFDIQNHEWGLGYFDSSLSVGNYRVNTIAAVIVSIDSLFGAKRFVNTLIIYDVGSSTGAHWGRLDTIRTIAGIGTDYISEHYGASGQGAPPYHENKLRILKGAVLDGVLYGDTAFTVSDIRPFEDLKQIVSAIDIKIYPNPFNSNTIIKYTLPESGTIRLKVFNILGQEVNQTIEEYREKGEHEWNFNAADLPSGLYIISFQLNKYSNTKKVFLIK